MIFKAIVTSNSTENENTVYITIPILDDVSSKNNFKGANQRLATICSLPGCIPRYAKGDVVYVDFEQDDMSLPVIIGSLMSSKSNNSVIDLYVDSLTVDVNTQLSGETLIDDTQFSNNSTNDSSGVVAQPIIDVVGLLNGEGKGIINSAETTPVDSIAVDAIPIEDSINLVESGGVYSALNSLNNRITYGDEDLVANVSPLNSGTVYFFYD